MRNLNVLLTLGVVFFFHAACSGDVEIEREGQDGSDTSDASSSAICQAYCSHRVQVGCQDDEASCVASCEEHFQNAGRCASVYGEIYLCTLENPASPPECTLSPKCESLSDAYTACVASAPCEELGQCVLHGLSEGGECYCKNDCSGTILESNCTFEPDGTTTCTCSFNGEVVGSCTVEYEKCNNLNGCCAAVFAESY
jgi:hypothetical protein